MGGLGDSYLWRELAQYFSGKDMPPERHRFEAAIIGAVWVLPGIVLIGKSNLKSIGTIKAESLAA